MADEYTADGGAEADSTLDVPNADTNPTTHTVECPILQSVEPETSEADRSITDPVAPTSALTAGKAGQGGERGANAASSSASAAPPPFNGNGLTPSDGGSMARPFSHPASSVPPSSTARMSGLFTASREAGSLAVEPAQPLSTKWDVTSMAEQSRILTSAATVSRSQEIPGHWRLNYDPAKPDPARRFVKAPIDSSAPKGGRFPKIGGLQGRFVKASATATTEPGPAAAATFDPGPHVRASDLRPHLCIGSLSLRGFPSAEQVELPRELTSLSTEVFSLCKKLVKVTAEPESATDAPNLPPTRDARESLGICTKAFTQCTALTYVELPRGVRKLNLGAFEGLPNLAEVILPRDLTSIGLTAFRGCVALRQITIPPAVVAIQSGAFLGCTALKSIVLPRGLLLIGSIAFEGCTELAEVTLSDPITSKSSTSDRLPQPPTAQATDPPAPNGPVDGTKAAGSSTTFVWDRKNSKFQRRSAPAETFGTSVSQPRVDMRAFRNCSRLTRVELPPGIQSIEGWAFECCDSLADVVIPEAVESFGPQVFRRCTSLKALRLPCGLKMISAGLFIECAALTHVEIPEGVTVISSKAFARCRSLESAVLPLSLHRLEHEAFTGCGALQSIALPPKVTVIRPATFEECRNLTTVTLAEGTTNICDRAFDSCIRLDIPQLPRSLSRIGAAAFRQCRSLRAARFSESLVWIGEEAFEGCVLLEDVTFTELPPNERAGKAPVVLAAKCFEGCRSLVSVTLPDVDKLVQTFKDCAALCAVRFPQKTLTIIGGSAFEGCIALEAVEIPSTVRDIGYAAFRGCSSLVSVVMPPSVGYLGLAAFADCSSLLCAALLARHVLLEAKSFHSEGCFARCTKLQELIAPAFIGKEEKHLASTPLLQRGVTAAGISRLLNTPEARAQVRALLYWQWQTHGVCTQKQRGWVVQVMLVAQRLRGGVYDLPPEMWIAILENILRSDFLR